jgi:hypothetical protein
MLGILQFHKTLQLCSQTCCLVLLLKYNTWGFLAIRSEVTFSRYSKQRYLIVSEVRWIHHQYNRRDYNLM